MGVQFSAVVTGQPHVTVAFPLPEKIQRPRRLSIYKQKTRIENGYKTISIPLEKVNILRKTPILGGPYPCSPPHLVIRNIFVLPYMHCVYMHYMYFCLHVQSMLSYVVSHVSQFQLSQSYGRDRLLQSAQFDSVTISCAADSGHWLFFSLLFSLFKCKTILINRRMKNLSRVKLDQL